MKTKLPLSFHLLYIFLGLLLLIPTVLGMIYGVIRISFLGGIDKGICGVLAVHDKMEKEKNGK